MKWNGIFRKPRYGRVTVDKDKLKSIPDDLWVKCNKCSELLYTKELQNNLKVCPKCDYHFVLTAKERLDITVDPASFTEYDANLRPCDPLGFPGYQAKLKKSQDGTGLLDAIITGEGYIDGHHSIIAIMDSNFMMGSMGSVVGEKLIRAIEMAIDKRLPLLVFAAGGGGARMQESMLSLMQMAKTSNAVARLADNKLPYISVLTNPTMGGVMASFAAQADVILAEPQALLGFSGPRVIKQTIRVELPEGFQTSEFLYEHGMIDMVVHRNSLKSILVELLSFFETLTGHESSHSI